MAFLKLRCYIWSSGINLDVLVSFVDFFEVLRKPHILNIICSKIKQNFQMRESLNSNMMSVTATAGLYLGWTKWLGTELLRSVWTNKVRYLADA